MYIKEIQVRRLPSGNFMIYSKDANNTISKDEIIQSWCGRYHDKTIGEAYEDGSLRIAQDGMMRGTPYYE